MSKKSARAKAPVPSLPVFVVPKDSGPQLPASMKTAATDSTTFVPAPVPETDSTALAAMLEAQKKLGETAVSEVVEASKRSFAVEKSTRARTLAEKSEGRVALLSEIERQSDETPKAKKKHRGKRLRAKFTRQSSTKNAFTHLESEGFRKSELRAVYDQSAEQSLTADELVLANFKEKLKRAPTARLVTPEDSRKVHGVRHTKSEVILIRVWNLLKSSKMEEALSTLMELDGVYQITDCVPGAGDDLPLWALMPSLLSRADALKSLPVWRYILKKFDVGNLKHVGVHGTVMTPMSISASYDLDEFVRAVIAEEELQGTVKEQVAFAEKCEVLQHNCILMIEAMRQAAADESERERRRVRTLEVVRETLRQEAADALDADALQRLATAVSQKLAEDSEAQLLESAFALMRDALISLTKEKRCVLSEVWNLCWEWQKLKGDKSLWLTVKQKIKDVLSFPQLHEKPSDWHWYLQNWAKNPLMAELSVVGDMDTDSELASDSGHSLMEDLRSGELPLALMRTKYDDICDMCETQLLTQAQRIEEDMGRMIAASEDAWKAVGGFSHVNPKFPAEENWRQDCIEYGVVAGVKLSDLFDISLFTSALDFDAAQTYDLDSYMTDVLTNAHWCNPFFQKFMQQAYAGVCLVHSGPVKGIERCRVKAQLDYYKSKFPTSARIIDLIRCSLTFEDIASFYETLTEFVLIADTSKIEKPSRRKLLGDALSKHGLKLDILRCKNGFAFDPFVEGVDFCKRSAGGLPVPRKYGDVKLNVIVTSVKRKVAVIGEVQFLLSAMLKAKLVAHEFYEVTRRQPFFQSVRKLLPVFTRNLKIAGSTQRQLTQLLVRQPLWFTEAVFTDTATDHANRNFLMRLVTTKDLKLDLAEYLLSLPTGIPDAVWLQKTEANMTLLKYVLGLADSSLMQLFLSKIPPPKAAEIWTLANPLNLAMEMRPTLPEFILESIPEAVDHIWNDSDLIVAAIQNRNKESLVSRLQLLVDHMSADAWGAKLRRPLPGSKLNMTPLMTAIRYHGIDAEVIDYLIPVYTDDEEKEMIEYWTHCADNGWTILTFASQYSDPKGFEVLKLQIPAEALKVVKKQAMDAESADWRRTLKVRKMLDREIKLKGIAPQIKKTAGPKVSKMLKTPKKRNWQRKKGKRSYSMRKKSKKKKKPVAAEMAKSSAFAAVAQDLMLNSVEATYGFTETEATTKAYGKREVVKPSRVRKGKKKKRSLWGFGSAKK